jgi:DNA mismatch repair protein MutL
VDPEKIDVNVHPTKTEIKFEEEKFIYSILMSSVRQALGKYNIAPTLEFDREVSFDLPHAMRSQTPQEPVIQVNPHYNPFQSTTASSGTSGSHAQSKAIRSQGFGEERASATDWANFYSIEDAEETQAEPEPLVAPDAYDDKKQFIVKGPYIFSPSRSGLMVIHVRRALERIVYDDIFNSFITNPIASQRLLFPVEKEVARKEGQLWSENKSILTQLGFEGALEGHILSVSAVPAVLQEESISAAIDGLLADLAFKEIDKGDIAHTMICSIARAASMKQRNLQSNEAIQALVDSLFACTDHVYSPGNKKIIETLSLDDIQLKFA